MLPAVCRPAPGRTDSEGDLEGAEDDERGSRRLLWAAGDYLSDPYSGSPLPMTEPIIATLNRKGISYRDGIVGSAA